MRKGLVGFLIAIIVTMSFVPALATDVTAAEKPKLMGQAALLIDAKTGKVLYDKNSKKEMYPASLTKMMTALVVLDKLPLDRVVTVAPEAVFPVGNNINLKEGEQLTVEELLNALMIYSANDAALALAIETSGSVQKFAEEMNAKAKEIGCKHTNYINPNGFTNDAIHHTTAEDLAKIANYGLHNKTFAGIVCKDKYTVPASNKNPTRKVETTNMLLAKGKYHYDGVIGVKTGFMALSGQCFVGAAEKEGMRLIGVSLNSGEIERFTDVAKLFDYGFDNFKTSRLMKEGEITGTIKVKYGKHTFVDTKVPAGAYITMPKSGDESLAKTKVILKDHVNAPIKAGAKVGEVVVYEDGKEIDRTPVVMAKAVKKGGPWAALYIADWVFYLVAGILLLIILIIVIVKIMVNRKRRRIELARQRQREEKAMEIARQRADKQQRGWPF